jgi:voltage-gated potassium channel
MPTAPIRPVPVVRHAPLRRLRVSLLYTRAILIEFRWTLLALAALVAIGATLHRLTPQDQLQGRAPSLGTALYAGWMALLAQPQYPPPQPAYLMFLYSIYPLFGAVVIGEGVIRLAQLMTSRRRGEKEWMMVSASTYRDHVVLCGLGRLGIRVLEQLVTAGVGVVVLEKSQSNQFVEQAKSMGVPVLLRDMKEDQALIDARIHDAVALVSCSNDDMANLEVAIDARRMNPKIRVVLRMFDQAVASKIAGAVTVDAAFSESALAAPVVAAMSMKSKVLSTMTIAGIPHVAAELTIGPDSALTGKTVREIEAGYASRVLAHTPIRGTTQTSPTSTAPLAAGDTLVVYCAASQLSTLAAAVDGKRL